MHNSLNMENGEFFEEKVKSDKFLPKEKWGT